MSTNLCLNQFQYIILTFDGSDWMRCQLLPENALDVLGRQADHRRKPTALQGTITYPTLGSSENHLQTYLGPWVGICLFPKGYLWSVSRLWSFSVSLLYDPFFGTRSSKQPGGLYAAVEVVDVNSLAVRKLSWLLLYKPGKKGKTLKIKSCTADQSTSQAESVQSARQSHTFEANHITHGQALKIAWQCNIL